MSHNGSYLNHNKSDDVQSKVDWFKIKVISRARNSALLHKQVQNIPVLIKRN